MMLRLESVPAHRVLAVYDDSDVALFQLPAEATLADLCERLARRAPQPGMLPRHVEVQLGR